VKLRQRNGAHPLIVSLFRHPKTSSDWLCSDIYINQF
jgi:hypothetical protein